MGSVGVMANSAKICALLLSHSVEQLVRDMYEAKAQGADVVEIRLDCINDFRPRQDLEIILKNKPLPVLIVYRYKDNYVPFVFVWDTYFEVLLFLQDLNHTACIT